MPAKVRTGLEGPSAPIRRRAARVWLADSVERFMCGQEERLRPASSCSFFCAGPSEMFSILALWKTSAPPSSESCVRSARTRLSFSVM